MKGDKNLENYTQYKKLELPTLSDHYDVNVFNKNAMIIDSELNKLDLKNESQDQLLATKESLNDEISRAQAKEDEISTDLDNETLRAMASEDGLSNDISFETNRAVMAEETIVEDLINHNISASAHSDIRDLISGLTESGSVTLTNNLLATTAGTALDATQGRVLNDKVDELNNNLGGCSFEQEGENFYIVGADAVRKKLGNNTLIGRISKNASDRITFNCTSIPNYSKLKSENFYITNITVLMHIFGGSSSAGSYNITPTVSYNQATGVLTVNNMFYGSINYNYTCIYNAEVWVK